MRVLLEPPGVAHVHAPSTLDAAHASDNVWVVNMLEGVNNLLVSRVTGFGAIVIIGATSRSPPASSPSPGS